MSSIQIDELLLEYYKRSLGALLPAVQASHRIEAFAGGFGFATYAALTDARKAAGGSVDVRDFSEEAFTARLAKLGYADIVVPREVTEGQFSYRTFVTWKNGFSFEAARSLAEASGFAHNQAALFAEMLCSQPLSQDEINILSEEQLRPILASPKFRAPPDGEVTWLHREIRSFITRAPAKFDLYRKNPWKLMAMLSMTNWQVTLERGQRWSIRHIVRDVRISKDAVEVSFQLADHGLDTLRMTQEALEANALTPEPDGYSDVHHAQAGLADSDAPGARM